MKDVNVDVVKSKSSKKIDNNVEIANIISSQHKLIWCASCFYEYKDGYYQRLHTNLLHRCIKDILEYDYNSHKTSEIEKILRINGHIEVTQLNDTNCLNLKNGLFNLETETLLPHTPDIYSSIRLNVSYSPVATCFKWIDTLLQIFQGNEDSINLLQEFFGLCLTKDTRYEKALFMIGEGSNGKSTLLYVLECLLDEENYTAIPLEKLNDFHYVADLFNKLANISTETSAKSAVYDARFKEIVSGDSIKADSKYKDPFTFRPYCKLIYALNNMPRVDDKTDAFYRRLLILRFKRQFKEEEQNKNLKYELLEELDGIFLWCVEGLRNLRRRGYFMCSKKMQEEINDYRAENNNVLTFVEEECELDNVLVVSKQALYDAYSNWCKDNGYRALSKKRFGKELTKQYPSVTEERTSTARMWNGIARKFMTA